jgi:dTMP kinase
MPLICLEGPDFAGKTTQFKLLQELFPEAHFYKYPDYTSEYGKKIKLYLAGELELTGLEQSELFFQDFLKDKPTMLKALAEGELVFTDRFHPSTVAYQSANGVPSDELNAKVNELGLLKPDFIMYLGLSLVDAGKRKRDEGRDIHESSLELQTNVRLGYTQLFKEEYEGTATVICNIDANASVEYVHNKILDHLFVTAE